MRIVQIDLYQVTYELMDKVYAWSGGHSVGSFTSSVLKLSTDEKISGFAEVCPLGSAYMEAYAGGIPSGIRELGPHLLGQDSSRLRTINSLMDSVLGGHNYVKALIDIACWDLLGKAAGKPISTLMGGRAVEEYPLYRAISQGSPEQMAETVTRYRKEGYRKFQLKVGGNPDVDILRIKAVLGVLEQDDLLIADANTGWLPHQAIRVANALSSEDFYMEAPCPSYEECLIVRRQTRLPFVLDEVITGVRPLLRALADGAMDVINLKISRVGGLTKALLIRNLCEASGIAMTIEDSWGGDITTATIAHLAGSTKPEFLFSSTDFNSYIDLRIAEDAPFRKSGILTVPSGPGLGITVDETKLGNPIVTLRL